MIKKTTLFLLVLPFSFLFTSCEDESLEAPIPAYLHIDDIFVRNLPPISDTASDQITDAWVYINDLSIGSFELPTVIPIQQIGKINLKIRGGVLNNGMTNSRTIYPFYDFFVLDTVLNAEEHIYINPVVPYREKTDFDNPWSGEDFESSINFERNPQSDTIFVREIDKSKVFEGNASGAAYLDPSMTFFEALTPAFSDIPRGTSPVYLEMDYKCTHDVVVSIYYNNKSIQYPIINLRPKSHWNKVYVELMPVFSELASGVDFNLAIGYKKPVGEVGALFVDNVKLLHFK